MQSLRNLISLLLLLSVASFSHATTITGTIRDSSGQLWNGSITFAPNASVIDYISHEVVPSVPIQISVINGSLYMTNGSATVTLKGNDTFLPSNTAYYALFKDVSGQPINLYLYSITGTTYDLGTAIPTPVTTTNISYGNLLGLNSVTIKPSSTSVTQLGIQTASTANIFSVVNNKVMIGNLLSGNSLLQLFGTSTATRTPNLTNPAGPYITLIDSGSSSLNGGGVIFGSNSSQFGAAIKYNLTDSSSNSRGEITLLTRHASADTLPRQVFSATSGGITIGQISGSTGGGINSDGGGFKLARTIFASANPSVDVSVIWTTAFPDTSYTELCHVSNGFGDTTGWETVGKSGSTLTIRVFGTAVHAGLGLNCIAIHDID